MDVYESMLKNNEQVDIVNTGLGMSALNAAVERAVGSNII